MADDNPSQFEAWATRRTPGLAPNRKKVGDSAIDGRGNLLHEVRNCGNGKLVWAQVTGGRFSLGQLRDFCHVIEREKAVAGMYITVDPVDTKAARQEERSLQPQNFRQGANECPRLQFYGIKDHFDKKSPVLRPVRDPYAGKQMQIDWKALIDWKEYNHENDIAVAGRLNTLTKSPQLRAGQGGSGKGIPWREPWHSPGGYPGRADGEPCHDPVPRGQGQA